MAEKKKKNMSNDSNEVVMWGQKSNLLNQKDPYDISLYPHSTIVIGYPLIN